MSLEADARAVAARAETIAGKRDRIARRLLSRERRRVDAYRACFLKDGELTLEAEIVLADISRLGRLGRDGSLASEPALRRQASIRVVVQHVFRSFALDPALLARLVRQLTSKAVAPSETHELQTGESE